MHVVYNRTNKNVNPFFEKKSIAKYFHAQRQGVLPRALTLRIKKFGGFTNRKKSCIVNCIKEKDLQ